MSNQGKITLNTNKNGGKLVVVQDSGAGSSGKGAIHAWLADKYKFNLATNSFMSNAGHFVDFDNGTRVLNQHICSSFVNPNIELYINAGAAIGIDILMNEIETIEKLGFDIKSRLSIHPMANVITQEDIDFEKENIKSGSTFKGCGAAIARKAMRIPGRKLAKDYDELAEFIDDKTLYMNDMISKGGSILVEGSQGVDLDLNHAEYPFVTSRQTVPGQLIADAGLPPQAVTNVVMNARTNPIRISNTSAADGEERYSGNYWDAKEISWDKVAIDSGWDNPEEFMDKYGFAMLTSVTKKIRRVFEFPKKRAAYVHAIAGGLLDDSKLLYSLNFMNFIDKNVEGVTNTDELMTDKVVNWLKVNMFDNLDNLKLCWIRTGPKHSQIIESNDNFGIK